LAVGGLDVRKFLTSGSAGRVTQLPVGTRQDRYEQLGAEVAGLAVRKFLTSGSAARTEKLPIGTTIRDGLKPRSPVRRSDVRNFVMSGPALVAKLPIGTVVSRTWTGVKPRSTPSGIKPTFVEGHGYDVLDPAITVGTAL
jgi:hypothetical protein